MPWQKGAASQQREKHHTIDNYGGEGASLFTVSDEGGRKDLEPEGEEGPKYTHVPIVPPAADRQTVVRVPGSPAPDSQGPSDDDTGHLFNWLNCMHTRKEPNATVDHGFSHALVCIMAAQSYWSGRELYWDPGKEQLADQAVGSPIAIGFSCCAVISPIC